MFQRRRELLSGGGLNYFLQAARCLGLVKCFEIFHFIWNSWRLNNFNIPFATSISSISLDLPHLSAALESWNFPENLHFKVKIVAKFFVRSHFLSTYNNIKIKQQINILAIFFSLSSLLHYSIKITNCGTREKKIFCVYDFFRVLRYVNGDRKSHLQTQSFFLNTDVCINKPFDKVVKF